MKTLKISLVVFMFVSAFLLFCAEPTGNSFMQLLYIKGAGILAFVTGCEMFDRWKIGNNKRVREFLDDDINKDEDE